MSSSDIAVSVRGLSKSYTIAHDQEKHSTLAETVLHRLKNPLKRAEKETFWALKDVSFDIKKGDVVGIIGRNGAGKSTLLKILSRITEPTSGEVRLHGRVGSLLEVGTGFHPELTGRENVYLNGAILGMKKSEIRKQFDAIVDFAEVEKFLDTPVKRYSSGMYVRLAFAVAAHLNPEILIVDEVLAVGDAEFQKKCLGKMKDVANGGRTVLFVSHNMGAINDLCSRCVLLDKGGVALDASTLEATRLYLSPSGGMTTTRKLQPKNADATFLSVALVNDVDESVDLVDSCRSFGIFMQLVLGRPIRGLQVGLALFNCKGDRIFYHSNAYADPKLLIEDPGEYVIRARVPGMFLVPGVYSVNIALHIPNVELYDLREHVLTFEIADVGSGRYDFAGSAMGCVLADVQWERPSECLA